MDVNDLKGLFAEVKTRMDAGIERVRRELANVRTGRASVGILDPIQVDAYGAKMPVITMAKRWTFIIDPALTIRQIEHNVDPAADAQRVAAEIARLKAAKPRPN